MVVNEMKIIIKNIKNILNIIVFKYIYMTILIFLPVLFYFDQKYNIFDLFNKESSNVSSLAGISGSFIGFLLTVATIYSSLPSDSKFKTWFKKYGHHKIFMRIIALGTFFFMLNIIFWIFNISTVFIINNIGIYAFISGCFEVLAAMYYLYFLIVKNDL